MSDQSLASLLAWLREESRMLGWGMIIALERDKANLVLRHEYIERFSGDDYLRPISGDVDVADNYWRGVLHNFIFDAPRLLFQTIDAPTPQEPTNTRVQASLAMSLMSGGLVSMENDNTVWRIRKVQAFDTLLDAKLYLHLEMPQTLVIGADGAIRLDFRFSDDFEMDLGADPAFNDQVAIALKSMFHELEDERRMYSLVVIPEGVGATLRPRAVRLYPQVSLNASLDPLAPTYGSGAILALAKMSGDADGTLPGPNFKYLIPDDAGKGYSATVLLERQRLLRAVDAGHQVLSRVAAAVSMTPANFNIRRDLTNGQFISATARLISSGSVTCPANRWLSSPLFSEYFSTLTQVEVAYARTVFSAADKLSVTYLGDDKYAVDWPGSGNCSVDINPAAGFMGNQRLSTLRRFDLHMGFEIGVGDEMIIAPISEPFTEFEFERAYMSCADQDFHPGGVYALECEMRSRHVRDYTPAYIDRHIATPFMEQLISTFTFQHSFDPSIASLISQAFHPGVVVEDIRSPLDTACFGSINPGNSTFEITPHALMIAPDATHQFTTNAPQGPLHWTASNIDPSSTSVAGSIGTDGTYRAPPLNSIRGNHTRVRVSATQDGNTASALVTVVAQPLAINPLIATCEADRSGGTGDSKDHIVELSAGLIQKEGATITWTIKNMIEGESGSVHPGADGHTCTFTAHPYLSTKKCVLDEVEVSVQTIENGQSVTRTRQALVLASHAGFGLNLFIEEATPHMLRLIAKRNDVEGTVVEPEWSVAAQSPGVIGEEDGIYVPDSASTQPFALIFAKVEGRLKSEGYLIVPLPYLDFPEELILLSQPHELVETNVAPSH